MKVTQHGAEALVRLESDWRDLQRGNCGPDALFAGHGFCRAVAGNLHRDDEPVILCAHHNGKLAAIWPLVLRHERLTRVLRQFGDPVPQNASILVDTAVDASQAARSFLGFIRAHRLADAMELKPAFASSGLIEAGQDQPIDTAPEHLAASPMADLRRWRGGSATALPGKLAKEINRKRRRLQQHGATSSRPATEPAERLKLLEMLLVWKRQWLDQRGLVSLSLSAPATTGMLGALLRDTESGAELMVLSVADKPVAIEFGFSDARHHFSYLASYDAAFEAHGPGSVLMADTMAMLARRGMETYDLMYPLEGYKRQWAHFARPVGACSMAFTLRGRLSQSLGGTAMRGLARGAWRTLPTAIRQPIARRIAG